MNIFSRGVEFHVPRERGFLAQAASADLTGDGRGDLVVAWEVGIGTRDQPIEILLNNGRGKFISANSLISGPLPTVVHPQEILIGNLQGTGQPDIFIADHGYDAYPFPGHQQKLVQWNSSGQLFDATANLPQELSFTHRAAFGDIDGSGNLDILYANLPAVSTPLPQLLVNDGTGHFTIDQSRLPDGVTGPGGLGNTGCLLTDLTGDGKPDLVLGGWDPLHTGRHPSVVYLNDGAGHFTDAGLINLPMPPIPLVNGTGPTALDIISGDLNHDGRPDLIIDWTNGNYTSHYYQILINEGGGHFVDETRKLLPQSTKHSYWTTHVYLVDLKNNGVLDLVVQPSNTTSPTIYLNNGKGHFRPAGTFGSPGDIITPLSEHGRTDFVALHLNGVGYIYHNLIAPRPHALGSIHVGGTSTHGADAFLSGNDEWAFDSPKHHQQHQLTSEHAPELTDTLNLGHVFGGTLGGHVRDWLVAA